MCAPLVASVDCGTGGVDIRIRIICARPSWTPWSVHSNFPAPSSPAPGPPPSCASGLIRWTSMLLIGESRRRPDGTRLHPGRTGHGVRSIRSKANRPMEVHRGQCQPQQVLKPIQDGAASPSPTCARRERDRRARVQSAVVKRIAVQLRQQEEIIAYIQPCGFIDGNVIRRSRPRTTNAYNRKTQARRTRRTWYVFDVQVPKEFDDSHRRRGCHRAAGCPSPHAGLHQGQAGPRRGKYLHLAHLSRRPASTISTSTAAIPGMSARVTFHFEDKHGPPGTA